MKGTIRLRTLLFTSIAAATIAAPGLADTGTTTTKETTTTGTVPAPVTTGPVATQVTPLKRIQMAVARINIAASTPEGQEAVVKRLSSQFKVPPDTLRMNHENWGLDYGGLAMVYSFAKASKKPVTPEQVLEMRRSGTEWDVIAKDLGINIQAVARKMSTTAAGTRPQPAPPTK